MPYHIDEENSELAFEVREGNKLVIKIKSNIFSDSLELYLIKVGDNTEPTDKNVFSSLRVLKEIENLHDTILKEINSVTSGFWELKQDSQGNEYISTKYNVLTEGGLTTYGLGEQKLGTIYDGLPIDNDTIYWEEVEGSRVLKAKGSGGGSTGLDETKLWNVLGTPGDQQIDYSHLRSAFSQFSNEFVTINTEQEITALKHFTAGLSIGSAKKKIYEKDGVLYIDSNVAITGALTMYATDGQSVSSIYDGLPIDNDTIYWETVEGSRVLKAKGSGGEAGSVQWGNISGKPTWIEDTKPTYNWYEIQGEKPFYTKEEVAAKFVTIDTEQEITALKHFTAGLSVGESKKKIYEENGVVYIDADVAVTGAMTFYASAGRSVSTIMDGVTVDEETITKGSDNVLRIKNAGAGSSFDENAMWSALSGSSDNQINKSHLTMALEGYATRNWVIENYATKSELSAVSNKLSDFLEGSDTDNIINKWKELEAFLSGMAETDNLAEILETKADKKYVDSTFVTLGTKQTITGEKTFSSLLNTAAIKASGEITTPSLAASDYVTIAGIKLRKLEDGALMLEGNLALTGALTMYASNGQSFDTIYDGLPIDNDTIYWKEVDGSRVLKAKEGSGSSFDKSAMWTALAGSTTEQINKSHLTTALTGYATESWVTSKNYAVKATTLAGYGITDGINAVSVTGTGNAVTAASISGHTLTLTKGSTFSLSGHKHAWSDITSGKPSTLSGYGITDAYTKTESDNKYPTKTGSGASGTWGINVTGNAGTATKLQTARTLWGRSFDGTANVSGNLDSVGNINASSFNSYLARNGNDQSKGIPWYGVGIMQNENFFDNKGGAFVSGFFGVCLRASGVELTLDYATKSIIASQKITVPEIYINGIRLHKTADGVITLEGNLAVTGGITTYAIDPVSASTIMDGVVVDGTTIKKENGKLVAVGGGEAGSVAWGNITGKPSVFATNIANITDLHSSWDSVLAAQKPAWLTAVSIATISDLHANWDALLKAAPSAYVTRWPTISEVTGKQNLVVKLNGGTTEGTNQFTYNATGAKTINITPAGIGAAASSHSHNAISASLTGTNALNMVYAQIADNDYFRLRVGGTASNAGYVEFATADDGNEPIYFRQYTGTFTTVKRTLTLLDGSGNSSFPGTVTAPTFNGNLAWSHITSKPTTLAGYGITDGVNSVSVTGTGNAITSASISGHSLTLTKGSTFLLSSQYTAADILAKLKTVDGAGSDLEADILALTGETGSMTGTNLPAHVGMQVFQYYRSGNGPTDLGNFLRIRGNNGGCAELFLGWQSDNNTNYIWYKSKRDVGSWGSWRQIAFTDMNVASASRLQNLKKIWGNLFDGSQNVEGNIDLGSMDIIGYGGARILQNLGGNLGINPNGNVGIGNTTPQYKLHVSGVIFSSSEIKGQRYVLDDIGATGLSSSDYFLANRSSIRFVNDIAVVRQGTFRPIIRWGDAMGGIGYNTRYVFGSVRDNTYDWGRIFMAVSNNDAGTSTGCSFSMYGAGYVEITGNILATGGCSFYGSDIRYKSITQQVKLSLSDIAKAPSFVYHWNKEGMKCDRLNLGGSAQYAQKILPWAVNDNDNFLSMDYATVAYTFAVHTARHLLTYESRTDKKIKKLENRVKYLEKQLKKLGYEEAGIVDDSGI